MSRQEATNVFNDGLIMDLNPLTTPDNVLTDCLNGTIITYNGNEFVLQNDQGNYRLRNCRLQENFIPIGVKEYAGILYIISYNPLTSETEIGSYPSPRRIFDTNDRDQVVTFTPIIGEGEVVIDTYENLSRRAKLQMYALSDDLQNFKLNPGDEFRLGADIIKTFPYQGLQFSILTEDKELFEINIPDEFIVPTTNIDSAPWNKVFWEIPGWLTGKYDLANLDQFYLNIKNIDLPEFSATDTFEFTLYLNTQLEISDNLFLKNSTINTDLQVEYTFWIKKIADDGTSTLIKVDGSLVPSEYIVDGENVRFVDNNGNLINKASFDGHTSQALIPLNYNNLSTLFYNNFNGTEGVVFADRSKNEIVYVSAVPVLNRNGVKVYYEQFRTNLEINLATINNAVDITAAENIYKYIIDDDSLTLSFDISGPFVNNSNIETWLEAYDLSEATESNFLNQEVLGSNGVTGMLMTDVNLFGQNTVDLVFEDIDTPSPSFVRENMYLLSIVFKERGNIIKRVNRLLISSITFNDFYSTVSKYDMLYLENWLLKYIELFNNITLNVTQDPITATTSEFTWDKGQWINGIEIDPVTETWTPDSGLNWYITTASLPADVNYYYSCKKNANLHILASNNSIKGKLWKDLNYSTNGSSLTINNLGKDVLLSLDGIQLNEMFNISAEIQIGGDVVSAYKFGSVRNKTIYTYKSDYVFNRAPQPQYPPCLIARIATPRDNQTACAGKYDISYRFIKDANGNFDTGQNMHQTSRTAYKDKDIYITDDNPTSAAVILTRMLGSASFGFLVLIDGSNRGGGKDGGKQSYYRTPFWGTGDRQSSGSGGFNYIFMLFKTGSRTIAVPLYNGTGTYGALSDSVTENNTSLSSYPGYSGAITKFQQAIFYATNIVPRTVSFVFPSSKTVIYEDASVKNLDIQGSINDIIYMEESLITTPNQLLSKIQTLEGLLPSPNIQVFPTNNLTYTPGYVIDNDLLFNSEIDTVFNLTISVNNWNEILTTLSNFENYMNNVVALDAQTEADSVLSGQEVSQQGFYVDNKNLSADEENIYKQMCLYLSMSGTTPYFNGSFDTFKLVRSNCGPDEYYELCYSMPPLPGGAYIKF